MVDYFRYHEYEQVKDHDKSTKHKWDLEELPNGFQRVTRDNFTLNMLTEGRTRYKCDSVFELFKVIYVYIYTIKELLNENKGKYGLLNNGASLFVMTPHTVQEMPKGSGYHGLNKPKCVVFYHDEPGVKFGNKDNHLRAGYKHVLLEVCNDSNDKFKTFRSIKDLLMHELSHTLCNHVSYRDEGNHLKDFDDAEKFLTTFVSKHDMLKKLEEQMKKILSKNK